MVMFGDVDFTQYFFNGNTSVTLLNPSQMIITIPTGMCFFVTEIFLNDGTNDGQTSISLPDQNEIYGGQAIALTSGVTDDGISFSLPLKVQNQLKISIQTTATATSRNVYVCARGFLVGRNDIDKAFNLIVANKLK